jgi:hypothetical protein
MFLYKILKNYIIYHTPDALTKTNNQKLKKEKK